jgi:hypothetical protein
MGPNYWRTRVFGRRRVSFCRVLVVIDVGEEDKEERMRTKRLERTRPWLGGLVTRFDSEQH